MTPLADPLHKVSLRKIDLELEVLETVVLVEEEEKGSSRTPQSHSREESDRTQERNCADRGRKRRRVCRGQPPLQLAYPLLSQESCASLMSAERKTSALPSAADSPSQLIQELGERANEAVDLCSACGQQAFQEQNTGRGGERLFTACYSHSQYCYFHSY